MKKGQDSGGKREEDIVLWRQVTRSIKAYPLKKKPLAKKPAVSVKPSPKTAPVKAMPVRPEIKNVRAAEKGFDRSTATKLKRGKLSLEGRLDLHGMTQPEAYAALRRFIHEAIEQEKRTVLVITGKGRQSEGVLKRMLPLWLEESGLHEHVIAITEAQPKDGGSGAFYIRLRKKRAF